MSRQERSARATARASARAEAIIKEATENAKLKRCKCGATGTVQALRADGHGKGCQADASTPGRPVRTRVADRPGSAGSDDLAAECKRLRDEGMAWWAIGAKLSLPGAGTSAANGKSGAARARALYRQANGGQPAPHARAERAHGVNPRRARHAGNTGSKAERKMALVENGHVIPEDMEDEAVIAMLAGRTIEWGVNLADLSPGPDHWINNEARVHPKDVVILEEDRCKRDGSRVVRFREFLGYDDDRRSPTFGEALGGATRTVRVNAIHTVR